MANSSKNIVITPNVGQTPDPEIAFSGADASTGPFIIKLIVYADGTLGFVGSSGQLFSIVDDLTGTIFSVNDISGIPSIEVDADGTVKLAEFGGNVGVGVSVPVATLDVGGTSAAKMPVGTTAQRPTGVAGMIRFNSSLGYYETYNGSLWVAGLGFTGSQGIIGFTGSQGVVGGTGFTGSQGVTGSPGPTGFTGSQGTVGGIGSPGPTGFTGSQGIQGNTGGAGSTGFTGSQGIQGNTGNTGGAGSTGFTGSQGIQGNTGGAGSTGFTGSQGTQGIQGVTGFTGSKGFTGSLGYTGSGGSVVVQADTPPGSPVSGQLWWNSALAQLYVYYNDGNSSQWVEAAAGTIGYTGSQGVVGFTGSRGVTGFTGSRGVVGFTGSKGATGTTGFTGSRGATVVLDSLDRGGPDLLDRWEQSDLLDRLVLVLVLRGHI